MKFSSIRILFLDCDGVLTDGGVYFDDSGREFRRFNIKDGAGIKKLQRAGVHVAVISSSPAEPLLHRAAQLGIDDVAIGVADKVDTARDILMKHGLNWSHAAFMGDDLADLKLLRTVEYPIAVADAIDAVKLAAEYITRAPGGHGAVREVADLIVPGEESGVPAV